MSRSRISLEPTEVDEEVIHGPAAVREVGLFIDREDEPDEEVREQILLMTPAEMGDIYMRLKRYYEQGIWSMGSVER